MRIRNRKQAKFSLLLHTKPCALLHTPVCLLNQSPWDVINFSPPPTPPSPPPHQGGGDGVSDGNISSGAPDRDEDHRPEYYTSPPSENETKAAPAALCCKTDGKSWKCPREAATGAYLCEHHLSQAKNSYSTSSRNASKKPVTQRTQPKKASTVNKKTSNPYEFYYYSGFGPQWGKRRGENSNHNNTIVNDCGGIEKGAEREDDEIKQAAAYENNSDFEEYDEDEWNRANSGKKRGRKPIKARSLKSLM